MENEDTNTETVEATVPVDPTTTTDTITIHAPEPLIE